MALQLKKKGNLFPHIGHLLLLLQLEQSPSQAQAGGAVELIDSWSERESQFFLSVLSW